MAGPDLSALRDVRVPSTGPERRGALVVRAVTGEDERLALGAAGVQRALTGLIARCVRAADADEPLGEEAARALSVAERNRLALALGAASDGATFVERVRCVARDCRAWIDVPVRAVELPERLCEPGRGTVAVSLPGDSSRAVVGHVVLRFPAGADLEALEAFCASSGGRGVSKGGLLAWLLDRLLVDVSTSVIPCKTVLWTTEDRQAAWTAVRASMGGPETNLDVRCGTCGERFFHRLAPLGWLLGGGQAALERLRGEVELLGHALGWTEEEVLWLPRPKRRAYATLLLAA